MIQTIARRQFNLRLRAAQRNRSTDKWSAHEANARLYPWVAAALRCWVDPADIAPALATELADRLRSGMNEGQARAIMALDYASQEDLRTEIARARDAEIRAKSNHAPDLAAMAAHLGCPPMAPRQQQKEAA